MDSNTFHYAATESRYKYVNSPQVGLVRGLPNPKPMVSCYANSLVQCLVNCWDIRNKFENSPEPNPITKVLMEYSRGLEYQDIMRLRSFAGEMYSEPEQQDVTEFLMDLCNKSPNLSKIMEHEIVETRICPLCGDVANDVPLHNLIYPLALPNKLKKRNLMEIFNQLNDTDIKCSNLNCSGIRKSKSYLMNIGEHIIFQFKIFKNYESGKTYKITGLTMKNIQEEFKIGNCTYRVESVILHPGNSINSGHYTSLLRSQGKWILADGMTVRESLWNECDGNPFVLFSKKTNRVSSNTSSGNSSTRERVMTSGAKIHTLSGEMPVKTGENQLINSDSFVSIVNSHDELIRAKLSNNQHLQNSQHLDVGEPIVHIATRIQALVKENMINSIIQLKRKRLRLDFGSLVERRIEARRLALSAIYSRESHVSRVKYCLKKCQEKLQLSLIRLGEKPVLGNEEFWLAAICGTAYGKHVSSSETFFSDAVRYPMNYASHNRESGELVINEDGKVMDILPVTEELKRGGKSWECTGYCKKVNPDILIELTRLS
ncbi:hypothetical protein QAD02_021620 [Eretmocerus hayati]|uniref:Uncharacterized protein n=1 Tax=Eretmocerus hayati TaxID=131215 RepID=A0ACC2PTX5_9HYME|nr:hypothetical protein QAD02_021620 [Eretmocerus hayati]